MASATDEHRQRGPAAIKYATAPAVAGEQAHAGDVRGRDRRSSLTLKLAVVLACAAATLACFFAFPTYPTYDSLYALLWGRDLLHLQLPDIGVYRAPTEHPLAIAFGMFCSLFGQAGARVMVLGSIASFVALTAGAYRLARVCFGPLVGILAVLLVLSRFFVENLALQGYLDVTYAALVVWAAALEAQKPRRGWPVQLLLCMAGLLRPEAWLLGGIYWLWCAWPAPPWRLVRVPSLASLTPQRPLMAQLGLALLAPLAWMGFDAALTGDPLYSLYSTSGLARELGRAQGFNEVLSSTWAYAVRIDKLPVVLGGVAGVVIALTIVHRSARERLRAPIALLICAVLAFVLEGVAGASVLDRYMLTGAVALLPFCALALGGWSLLERGSAPRHAWLLAAGLLAVYGALQVNATLSLRSLQDTLAYHEQLDQGLSDALGSTALRRALSRCPLLSLPNNKLLPDALWLLPRGESASIVARSQARELADRGLPSLERRLKQGSVALYPLPVTHFFDAVAGVGEERGAPHSLAGSRRIYSNRDYLVYANC